LLLVFFGGRLRRRCGIYALAASAARRNPDLSDTQVIVYTEYSGSGTEVIEDQVTYPADDGNAHRAAIEGGAGGFSCLGGSIRLHHLRGRHRHLLGPFAGVEFLNAPASRLPAGRHANDGSGTPAASDGSTNTP